MIRSEIYWVSAMILQPQVSASPNSRVVPPTCFAWSLRYMILLLLDTVFYIPLLGVLEKHLLGLLGQK